MGSTTFSGPIKAGTIKDTTGTDLGKNVKNTGQVVMSQTFAMDLSSGALSAQETDVVIPANGGVTFGTGEKIEGDSTDLTVTSGGLINLTATTDVAIPANVGITFGTHEKIESDDTDLTITV